MNTFDKAKFAELLTQAKGTRSINQYWLESEVSATYISKLLRSIVPTPPSPQVIQKLANKAHNGVTYNDLMSAAGHLRAATPQEIADIMENNPNHWTKLKHQLYAGLSPEHKDKLLAQISEIYSLDKESANKALSEFILKIEALPLDQQLGKLARLIDFQTTSDIKPLGKRIKIPVVGTVCAGNGGYVLEDDLGTEYVDAEDINTNYRYFWLRVKGDSMVGEGIFEDDFALVRKTSDVDSGCLAIVMVDKEEGRIKRLIKKDNAVVLQAANPAYPTTVFVGSDVSRLIIVGEVIETKRNYKKCTRRR